MGRIHITTFKIKFAEDATEYDVITMYKAPAARLQVLMRKKLLASGTDGMADMGQKPTDRGLGGVEVRVTDLTFVESLQYAQNLYRNFIRAGANGKVRLEVAYSDGANTWKLTNYGWRSSSPHNSTYFYGRIPTMDWVPEDINGVIRVSFTVIGDMR